MPATTGRFTEGKDKGKSWQVYQDPASKTGWTRKVWNPYDVSNNGAPTEYFGEFDMAAAEVDEQSASEKAAKKAAERQQLAARQAAADTQNKAFWDSVIASGGKRFDEDVRQFNVGQQTKDREINVRDAERRDRLRLGLRELELSEANNSNTDLRSREKNVLSYLDAIGSLRLPYPELVALSQRAVAGIVPGAAGQGGKGNGGGGALTADQWAAIAQGTARNWEQRQAAGQGNPLAG